MRVIFGKVRNLADLLLQSLAIVANWNVAVSVLPASADIAVVLFQVHAAVQGILVLVCLFVGGEELSFVVLVSRLELAITHFLDLVV